MLKIDVPFKDMLVIVEAAGGQSIFKNVSNAFAFGVPDLIRSRNERDCFFFFFFSLFEDGKAYLLVEPPRMLRESSSLSEPRHRQRSSSLPSSSARLLAVGEKKENACPNREDRVGKSLDRGAHAWTDAGKTNNNGRWTDPHETLNVEKRILF